MKYFLKITAAIFFSTFLFNIAGAAEPAFFRGKGCVGKEAICEEGNKIINNEYAIIALANSIQSRITDIQGRYPEVVDAIETEAHDKICDEEGERGQACNTYIALILENDAIQLLYSLIIEQQQAFESAHPDLVVNALAEAARKEKTETEGKMKPCNQIAQEKAHLDLLIEQYTQKAAKVFGQYGVLHLVPSPRVTKDDPPLGCEGCPEKEKLYEERKALRTLLKSVEKREDAAGCRPH